MESVTPVPLALTPLFAHARGALKLTLLGGTHINAAQSYEMVESTWGSLIRRAGVDLSVRLMRSGFMPRGGGELVASFAGHRSIQGFDWIDRGELKGLQIVSAACSVPTHVQQRQASRAKIVA